MPDHPVHLVTGATGKVGREVIKALEARGAQVRGTSHNKGSSRPGGVPLDFSDQSTFRLALEGVDSLFLMRPPQITNVATTVNAFLDQAVASGVRNCVFLSIAGADRQKRLPHRKIEDHLRTLPIYWSILGPGFFSQNFVDAYLGDIRAGELVLPAGNARVAFIDTQDIAEVAAMAMLDPARHHGKSYHLTGAEALTFEEAVGEISRQLGRVVRYRSASAIEYALRQLRARSPLPYALMLTIIHVGLRNGSGAEISPDLKNVLGRNPTTFADFVTRSLPCLASSGQRDEDSSAQ